MVAQGAMRVRNEHPLLAPLVMARRSHASSTDTLAHTGPEEGRRGRRAPSEAHAPEPPRRRVPATARSSDSRAQASNTFSRRAADRQDNAASRSWLRRTRASTGEILEPAATLVGVGGGRGDREHSQRPERNVRAGNVMSIVLFPTKLIRNGRHRQSFPTPTTPRLFFFAGSEPESPQPALPDGRSSPRPRPRSPRRAPRRDASASHGRLAPRRGEDVLADRRDRYRAAPRNGRAAGRHRRCRAHRSGVARLVRGERHGPSSRGRKTPSSPRPPRAASPRRDMRPPMPQRMEMRRAPASEAARSFVIFASPPASPRASASRRSGTPRRSSGSPRARTTTPVTSGKS